MAVCKSKTKGPIGFTAVVFLALSALAPAWAADFYASPTGSPKNPGTRESPWNLPTVLSAPKSVHPGDTVWLLAGTYTGPFECHLKGSEGNPITLRAIPGQRVMLDAAVPGGKKFRPTFDVLGDHVVLWGLELTCSDPKRKTAIAGSWPEDIQRGGIFCRSSHVKIINCVLHDGDTGVGFWSDGEGGEIYGCLIYNNGWTGPDRGHGHAIYTQNKAGTKRIVDNIMFNQFGEGLHAYGSEKAALKGFHVEGNVSFNNGSGVAPDNRTGDMLIGGGCRAEDIVVKNNFTYGDEHGGGSVRFGYPWGKQGNGKIILQNNYFGGRVSLLYWDQVVFQNNTVIAPSGVVHVLTTRKVGVKDYLWEKNAYHRTGKMWEDFSLGWNDKFQSLDWTGFQKAVADQESVYHVTRPAGGHVFVRPNRYEPGRGHVIVYNWDRKKVVLLDLSEVLKKGQAFRIVSAQDYFGETVVEGKYDGTPVALPMREYHAVVPVGMPDHKSPVTGPEFNVFVVMPAE
jgi:hypothetical protein